MVLGVSKMGWYGELKESDWFSAIKDVGDGLTEKLDPPIAQKQVISTVESPSNVGANVQDVGVLRAGSNVEKAKKMLSDNKVILAGLVALSLVSFLIIKRV